MLLQMMFSDSDDVSDDVFRQNFGQVYYRVMK